MVASRGGQKARQQQLIDSIFNIACLAESKEFDRTTSATSSTVEDFTYDPKEDVYVCPAGELLRPLGKKKKIARGR